MSHRKHSNVIVVSNLDETYFYVKVFLQNFPIHNDKLRSE